jgi:hypothetical protein
MKHSMPSGDSVGAGYSNADWSIRDPDLKILHDDPEFKKLVAERARPAIR